MDNVSQALVEALENNKPVALATVVKTRGASPRNPGAKMLVYPNGSIVGSVGGGEMEIFVEPLLVAPTLLLVGAGHVGAACAQLAKFLGFHVVVLDDRPEFVTPENFPHADERIAGDIVAEIGKLEITPRTYVVFVTRAHTLDAALLGAIIENDAAYIGMLGSQRRVLTVKKMLKEKGVSEATLDRVHAPIGIEIHAETPQEIAVSIMAEVIQAKRQK
ncbi:MAG: hypothetical protein A2Z03_09000 [Chloroflexi bacterium RBG_16_56_8]|nr:MAG: hypothetical protein A2Z03_09000 [Chloroflexi bacterium RBG_16_56_8]